MKLGEIVSNGHTVPGPHRTVVNKQSSIELAEAKHDDKWAQSVVPLLAADGLGDDAEWSIDQCLWSTIPGVWTSDVVKSWLDSVFTNALWNLLDDIANPESRSRLIVLTALYLEQMEHIDLDIFVCFCLFCVVLRNNCLTGVGNETNRDAVQ